MDYFTGMCVMTGYTPTTTFWSDFSIADRFGIKAIKDTYKRSWESWKSDIKYIAELYLVLNWKIWEHHELGNEEISKVYNDLLDDLYEKVYADNAGYSEEDMAYFFEVTD